MPRQILVIEDDTELVSVYTMILQAQGYEVILGTTDDDVLDRCRRGEIDCLVVDYFYPGGDKGNLIRQLRSDPGTTKIPVVLATAYGDMLPKESLPPVNAILTKPFNVADLVRIIRECVAPS